MKRTLGLLFLLFLSCLVFSTEIVEMSQLEDLANLHVDRNQMYITERATKERKTLGKNFITLSER